MGIRNDAKSNSPLGRLRDRIRSTLFTDTETTDDAPGAREQAAEPSTPSPDAPGNLFHCATCGTVYIDAEKSRCSTCDEDVEQVSSTLESSLMRP
ncbi:hypothetical protein GS429_09130 [Natronorubrum sp. JWXQ-INN-674]|uniref:Small CPxCG-related zinc finger protein n=1 Tax=Natronorubrum halalkaliphilum TaxID=2691917 RepID=A0A6B0VKX7_9EURY|nr:hypothetical protein [Natronorubrum halalkaliphilum]MXV62220.1 hypothetical protein [Natronorubrum halalkaliphilum]